MVDVANKHVGVFLSCVSICSSDFRRINEINVLSMIARQLFD